jgi:DNA processing protein
VKAVRRSLPLELDERGSWIALASADGVGPVGFAELLERYGSASAVLGSALDGSLPESRLRDAIIAAAERVPAIREAAAAAGVEILTPLDAGYPTRLRRIRDPPPVLYCRGSLEALSPGHAVAIVGTRRATDAGRRIASRIAGAIAGTGTTIVSGLAVGIDGVAHAAALHERAPTIAVLGSGHRRIRPSAHRGLARRIERDGGAVVAELPVDGRSSLHSYPRRNRIISALADATIVIEAPLRSGALITARLALEQGRECYVVPGPIDAASFAGSLHFLREHDGLAHVVVGVDELLDDLDLTVAPTATAGPPVRLGATEGRIAEAIADGISTIDGLVRATDLAPATILGAITGLELRGLVIEVFGRYRPHGPLATRGRSAIGA